MDHLDILSSDGRTLTTEQRAILQTARFFTSHHPQQTLTQLKTKQKQERVEFLGLITGVKRDYMLAECGPEDIHAPAKAFFSHNGIDWHLLPPPPSDPEVALRVSSLQSLFSGDPAKEYVITLENREKTEPVPAPTVKTEPAPLKDETWTGPVRSTHTNPPFQIVEIESEPEAAVEITPVVTRKKRTVIRLAEDERLAAVVAALHKDAFCVPRGALLHDAYGKVLPNPLFQGLAGVDALSLNKYVHNRPAKALLEKTLLAREGLDKSLDFMDPIGEDVPAGVWSLHQDGDGIVRVRSLLWPGYSGYHIPRTRSHGGVYFGTGVANRALLFSLP